MTRGSGCTALLVPLCAVALGCGRSDVPAPVPGANAPAPAPGARPATPLVSLEIYQRGAVYAASLDRAGIRELFGEPDSARAQATANRHDPSRTDTIVTLHYPAARYIVYVVTGGRELMELADIETNAHLRHTRPGIGTPVDSLRAWFGEPTRGAGAELEYECLTCEVPQPVTFHIRDGRVRRIVFDFYVD